MAAESDDLPDAVKAEVKAFGDMNIAWLEKVLARIGHDASPSSRKRRAAAIYAAVAGAQLAARSRSDIAVYDIVIETYQKTGLIPIRNSRQCHRRPQIAKNRDTTAPES